jgi:hypothetical protein
MNSGKRKSMNLGKHKSTMRQNWLLAALRSDADAWIDAPVRSSGRRCASCDPQHSLQHRAHVGDADLTTLRFSAFFLV